MKLARFCHHRPLSAGGRDLGGFAGPGPTWQSPPGRAGHARAAAWPERSVCSLTLTLVMAATVCIPQEDPSRLCARWRLCAACSRREGSCKHPGAAGSGPTEGASCTSLDLTGPRPRPTIAMCNKAGAQEGPDLISSAAPVPPRGSAPLGRPPPGPHVARGLAGVPITPRTQLKYTCGLCDACPTYDKSQI